MIYGDSAFEISRWQSLLEEFWFSDLRLCVYPFRVVGVFTDEVFAVVKKIQGVLMRERFLICGEALRAQLLAE